MLHAQGVAIAHRQWLPPEAHPTSTLARVAGESQASWRAFASRLAAPETHGAAAFSERSRLDSACLENEDALELLSRGSLPDSTASASGCVQ